VVETHSVQGQSEVGGERRLGTSRSVSMWRQSTPSLGFELWA